MPLSTSNQKVQNAAHFWFSPSFRNRLNHIEKLEGLSLVHTSFAPETARARKTETGHVLRDGLEKPVMI